jgi:predicted RNA-binding Zn-ribbon protein involved in translation (DUF1610 family)
MRAVRSELPARFQLRTCLRCGYCGPELQSDRGERTFACPACGEDLYARPARSYAELEGLDEAAGSMGHWDVEGLEGRFARAIRRVLRALARLMVQGR